MHKRKLIIIGSGGHGRSVAEAAILSGEWNEIAFVDDAYPRQVSSGAWPIVANTQALRDLIKLGDSVIVAIGNQSVRKRLFFQAQEAGAAMVSIIHPKAWISEHATIGAGTAVMAGAIVGFQTRIGIGSIINANATADHDVVLGDFAHLGVGVQLAGGVVIGDGAWLQAGVAAGYRVVVSPHAVVAPGVALTAVGI